MKTFYLGTHMPSWLQDERFANVPLFVSRRRLVRYKRYFPKAVGKWALDSGGFTELSMYGGWKTSPEQYADEVGLFSERIGNLQWAAPQDWMCEPHILEKTGLCVRAHQERTVNNLLTLRTLRPDIAWVPVLQGWTIDDYLQCAEMYKQAGVNLLHERTVGIGTICRRQGTQEAEKIVRLFRSMGLRIHVFGAKITGLARYSDAVQSADSLAWSFNARKRGPLETCKHPKCNNCALWALRWLNNLTHRISEKSLPQQLVFPGFRP